MRGGREADTDEDCSRRCLRSEHQCSGQHCGSDRVSEDAPDVHTVYLSNCLSELRLHSILDTLQAKLLLFLRTVIEWLFTGLVASRFSGEEALRAEDVDAAFGVDELGYVDVAGGGDERVGVVAGEGGEGWAAGGGWLGEEGDHVADGHLGGVLEVFVEAHGDVLGGGLGAGPEKSRGVGFAFVDDELEGSGEQGFEGGDVDLAVALSCVAVAGFEEASGGVDGVEDGGSGDELLVVHVAAVHPGWGGVRICRRWVGRCPWSRRRGGGRW